MPDTLAGPLPRVQLTEPTLGPGAYAEPMPDIYPYDMLAPETLYEQQNAPEEPPPPALDAQPLLEESQILPSVPNFTQNLEEIPEIDVMPDTLAGPYPQIQPTDPALGPGAYAEPVPNVTILDEDTWQAQLGEMR